MKWLVKSVLLLYSYFFKRNNRSKVVYYHDVSKKYTGMGTSIASISSHIDVITKCGFSIVPKISNPIGQVQICFDDGWLGLYESKTYFINKHITPLVFIAVDLIGQPGYMNESQITELIKDGFIFGCHSWSHSDLSNMDNDSLKRELIDSKKYLESLFKIEVDSVCFPMGKFNDQVIEVCKEAGYSKLYSSILGSFYEKNYKNVICRILLQDAPSYVIPLVLHSESKLLQKRSISQQYS